MIDKSAVLFFDGECKLCSSWVQFVLKHERAAELKFAALQGSYAQAHLPASFRAENRHTLVLQEGAELYTQSTAALQVLKRLPAFRFLYFIGMAVPKFLRDGVYRLIAKNRYQWFGRRNTCFVPAKSQSHRFYT